MTGISFYELRMDIEPDIVSRVSGLTVNSPLPATDIVILFSFSCNDRILITKRIFQRPYLCELVPSQSLQSVLYRTWSEFLRNWLYKRKLVFPQYYPVCLYLPFHKWLDLPPMPFDGIIRQTERSQSMMLWWFALYQRIRWHPSNSVFHCLS